VIPHAATVFAVLCILLLHLLTVRNVCRRAVGKAEDAQDMANVHAASAYHYMTKTGKTVNKLEYETGQAIDELKALIGPIEHKTYGTVSEQLKQAINNHRFVVKWLIEHENAAEALKATVEATRTQDASIDQIRDERAGLHSRKLTDLDDRARVLRRDHDAAVNRSDGISERVGRLNQASDRVTAALKAAGDVAAGKKPDTIATAIGNVAAEAFDPFAFKPPYGFTPSKDLYPGNRAH
jgi:hypothetical protein